MGEDLVEDANPPADVVSVLVTRFNNSFQIGMLSSFESFLETVGASNRRRRRQDDDVDEHDRDPTFDGRQGRTVDEKLGIDTDAITSVVTSYRSRFGRGLPHPKLDATADAFATAFETGEKTLVFVRRVRTVEELAAKLDLRFDHWIRTKMLKALPDGLGPEVDRLFHQYEQDRLAAPSDRAGPRILTGGDRDDRELRSTVAGADGTVQADGVALHVVEHVEARLEAPRGWPRRPGRLAIAGQAAEHFVWFHPPQRLSKSIIELARHRVQFGSCVDAEVSSLWEVLAEQIVAVRGQGLPIANVGGTSSNQT